VQLRLDGVDALVTGGSRGIGRATTLTFAHAGATVVTCYRHDGPAVEELKRELHRIGGRYRMVKADVTDADDVDRLMDECRRTCGGLDVVVNNAGTDGIGLFEVLTDEEWLRVLDADLTGVARVTRAAVPLLRRRAVVVNLGSAAAARGVPGRAHYGAAKAGIVGLTRALSKELGARGIRVNTVAPGVVATGPADGAEAAFRERIAAMTALGRLAKPQDVADAVLFLASGLATYVTGITLTVDGGM
jgi:3-oxoacyl-[acyl-carrier protein] reductase